MTETNRALILGPLPPAIGGVETLVNLLRVDLMRQPGVKFIDTRKPDDFVSRLLRPGKVLAKLIITAGRSRGGSVLMFCSAYGSFWEKCLWCIVSKHLGLRTIVQMVDGNFPRFYEGLPRYLKEVAVWGVSYIDVLVAQSESWKAHYRNAFPKATVAVISPGLDTQLEVLYVGWLIKEKGVFDLLEAAARGSSKGLRFRLKLIGPDCGNYQRVQGCVRRLDISELVDVLEPVRSAESLREIYRSADIFVFPSHFEGFPFALIEAVSSGLPCIASRVGGMPDILKFGECGLLIDSGSIEQLADALSRLVDDEDLRMDLGKRARTHAVNTFDLRTSLDTYTKVLNI